MKTAPLLSRPGIRGTRRSRTRERSGFTMIEIAISLAVIAFALVAIIGILPTGMNVQRENREETIINQDANFLMNAVRNGERGINDLTNYVLGITNTVTPFRITRGVASPSGASAVYWYTYLGSSMNPPYPITNGYRIIGLLSTPKYTFLTNAPNEFLSNHVVASVLALSGSAGEKAPQTNSSVRDLAMTYRLIMDVAPFQPYDPWGHVPDPWGRNPPPQTSTNDFLAWSNYWAVAANIQTNLHEVRMTYRWPLFNNGRVGNGRQLYRTVAGGDVMWTNEPAFDDPLPGPFPHRLYFFQPRTYVKAP